MTKNADRKPPKSGSDSRDDRLKAALKANLQRRKHQAKARQSAEPDGQTEQTKGT